MMRANIGRRHGAALLLALAVVGAGLPGIGLADDNGNDNKDKKDRQTTVKPQGSPQPLSPTGAAPDLKLEYDGLNSSMLDEKKIKFKVTNVGTGPSTGAVVRVVTSRPEPTPEFQVFDVKPLTPGQSDVVLYTMAASCNGHLVRALVAAPGDTNSANDSVEQEVCPPIPPIVLTEPPPVGAGVDYGASIYDKLPPHLLPGEHWYDVEPSVFRAHGIRRVSDGPLGDLADECKGVSAVPYKPHIGFDFNEGDFCDENFVFQLILDFDLQWLRNVNKKLFWGAQLLYKEGPRNVSGSSPTCVGRIGLAPRNWPEIVTRTSGTNSLRPTLLTTEDSRAVRLTEGPDSNRDHYWNLTDDVSYALSPLFAGQWHGIVLHGLNEDLGAEAQEICTSHVTNVLLRLHYTVL